MVDSKQDEFPKAINGIKFNSQEDYDNRVRQDVEMLAALIYDIYIDHKVNEE